MKKTEEEVLKDMSHILLQIKESYEKITNDEFNKIAKIVITKVMNDYNAVKDSDEIDADENYYYDFLENSINNYFQEELKKSKKDRSIDEIDQFIAKHDINSMNSIKNVVKFLNELVYLINLEDNSQDIKIKLLTGNEEVIAAIKRVLSQIDNSRARDKDTYFNQLIPDYNTQELIEMYMSLNSIELERDEEFLSDHYKDDIVKQYMADISRYPLLDFEDEQLLGSLIMESTPDEQREEAILELKRRALVENKRLAVLKAKTKEEQIKLAKEDLITHNLKLCISYAKHFVGCGLEFMDIISAGNMGLQNAVEKFDYTKGFKFSTYAIWWIKQAMIREIQNTSKTIRKPAYLVTKMNKYKAVYHKLSMQYGYEPTDSELLEALGEGWTQKILDDVKNLNNDVVSLSTPIGEDGDTLLEDFIPSDENVEEMVSDRLISENLHKILDSTRLDEKSKDIIKRRFGIDYERRYTLDEVGKVYGITRERVRQIEKKALMKLRSPKNAALIRRASSDTSIRYINNNDLNTPKSQAPKKPATPVIQQVSSKKETFKVRNYLYGIEAHTKEDLEWNRYYLILSAFVRENGDLNIPYNFKTKNGKDYCIEGYNIYRWALKQQSLYESSSLNKEKMDALMEIGFDFKYKQYMFNVFKDFCISNIDLCQEDKRNLMDWILNKAEELTYDQSPEARKTESTLEAFGFDKVWICNLKQFFEMLKANDNPTFFDEYFKKQQLITIPIVDWAKEQYELYLDGQLSKIKTELVNHVLDYRKSQIDLLAKSKTNAYLSRSKKIVD